MASVIEVYQAIALQNMLREQARADVQAELAANKRQMLSSTQSPPNEDEFHRLVRGLSLHRASVATIARELGYTQRHIRRVLEQMGLQPSEPEIPAELRARCETLRQVRCSGRYSNNVRPRTSVAAAPANKVLAPAHAPKKAQE